MSPDEVHAVTAFDAAQSQADGEVGLPDARWTEEQDIRRFRDEGKGRQLADLALVDGRLEGEVKVLQDSLERERASRVRATM